MGRVFEDVCRAWVARTARLPFRPSRVGAWWDASSANEIDVVALGPDREVLVAECKWGEFDDRDLATAGRGSHCSWASCQPRRGKARCTWPAFRRGEWGAGVAREVAGGTVLGFTGEDVLSF